MKLLQLLILYIFTTTTLMAATIKDTLILRSEYEAVGDVMYDINDPLEGSISYSILSGNSHNYYQINTKSGIISIATPITDVVGTMQSDTLLVQAGANQYRIRIADGLDYTYNKLKNRYTLLDADKDLYIDTKSKWTAYNNQWGSGTAVANTDFRVAILCKSTLPDSTILLWDTPSTPAPYAGAAVWCYHNIFFGNRKNMRENLIGFPFQIKTLDSLSLGFNFEQLYGNDEFKIAMNMFMTDESYLTNLANNDGDFFFVFDQKGTYIPPYPYSLPDTTIQGKKFCLRYDNVQNNAFYERRRAIILNNDKYLSGLLDINRMFRNFSKAGWLNTNQYIYHIQLGVEVTQGWGAVRINQAKMTMIKSSTTELTPNNGQQPMCLFPNPARGVFQVNAPNEDLRNVQLFDLSGRNVSNTITLEYKSDQSVKIIAATLQPGVYLLKCGRQTQKIVLE